MTIKSTANGTRLPSDLAEVFRQAGGLDESPVTLEDGFRAVTERLNEAGITVTPEDMYQPEPTRHAVDAGDTVEHVPCVMDALIIANLLDGKAKLYNHTNKELAFFKERIEVEAPTTMP